MADASSAKKQAEAASTTSHHVLQFSGLLGSGKYSDLTLKCGSRSWKVHKSVLCLQSDFFAKACDGTFKVRNDGLTRSGLPLTELQEAHTNTIDLSGDNEYTIAAMIHFMYHGNYDAAQILPSAENEAGVAMLLHVRIVGLAQKYFVEPLQKYAQELAIDTMKNWDGASSIFAEAVNAIYTGTENVSSGTTLRESAVSVAMDNALLIFGPSTEHRFRTREILLDETPGFMEDWARAMSYCKDTLSTANTNLEVVNDVLNSDNVKLNGRYETLKISCDEHKAVSEDAKKKHCQILDDYNKLDEVRKDLIEEMQEMFSIPDRPTANSTYGTTGPAPDCYKCPNCELLFFKAISRNSSYHHPCFSNGWCGKLGKGGVDLWYKEWQKHLIQKG